MDAKKLYEYGQSLFSKKMALDSLHQEIAMNFYVERADFTWQRSLGTDFASNLMTSYPLLIRRELADQFGQMLRPKEKPWFYMGTLDERLMDDEVRGWLEWFAIVMRRAMYDRNANFSKAMRQGDNDYAAFGQAVPSVQMNRDADGLVYTLWHLRDLCWIEDSNGKICAIWRKWKPSTRDLVTLFPKTVDQKVRDKMLKDPAAEIQCVHMVVAADMYDMKVSTPFVSIYYDVENETKLEETPSLDLFYSVERWQTVSGSQYAFSPATVAALPEARLLQAMTWTLLEAGEKATNPPLIADQNIFRSDVAMFAGGLTWADFDGDGKLADYLHVLTNDKSGLPLGEKQAAQSMKILSDAFYLNALKPFNPASDPQMTAYQAGQIVQDYIRRALPLFEPMEDERNGQICELTFAKMLRAGAFGPTSVMPRKLQQAIAAKQLQFRFRSPLHDTIEQAKGNLFMQMKQLTVEAVGIDQNAQYIPKAVDALRDALTGIGVPAKWTRDEGEVDSMSQDAASKQQAAEFLQQAQQGADVAQTISESRKNSAEAQPVPVQ